MKKDKALIILKRSDSKPVKGRKYCKKHGEDVTILPCDWCGLDIGNLLKNKHSI